MACMCVLPVKLWAEACVPLPLVRRLDGLLLLAVLLFHPNCVDELGAPPLLSNFALTLCSRSTGLERELC